MGVMRYWIWVLCVGFPAAGIAQLTPAQVEKKYQAYHSVWRTASLELSANQPKYAPGDTVFFKVYYRWDNGQLVAGRQLVQASLLDDQGSPLMGIKFLVNDGIGFNQIILSDTLTSGFYSLAAHSQWTRNFDWIPMERERIVVVRDQELFASNPTVAIEGGHLVQQVNNLVVISSRPQADVQLLSQEETLIASGRTDHLGFAAITFQPVLGGRYHVKTADGVQQLPAVKADGVVPRLVADSTGNSHTLQLQVPNGSKYLGQSVMVVLVQHGAIRFAENLTLESGELSFILPRLAKAGEVMLTVLDAAGDVLAYRNYHQHVSDLMVSLQPEKTMYGNREQVVMLLSIADGSGRPVVAEYSVRALNEEVVLESPSVEISVETMRKQRDWQMIATTKALPWKKILKDNYGKPLLAMTGNLERRGVVLMKKGNELVPVPDGTQVLFYLQRSQFLFQTGIASNGTVTLVLPDVYEDDEFFYLARLAGGGALEEVTVRWEEEAISFVAGTSAKETVQEDRYGTFASARQVIDQSYQSFADGQSQTNQSGALQAWTLAEPDVTVKVGDYIGFASMGELIKEVVPAIFYRKRKDKEVIRVKLIEPMPVANADPVYIIDGYATNDTQRFLSLKPSEVVMFGVVTQPRKLLSLGLLGKNGVVMVTTTRTGLMEVSAKSVNRVEGLSLPVAFNAKVNTTASNVPVFRSTVLWNPLAVTDQNGKARINFTTTDDTGIISVRVEGTTSDGRAFAVKTRISVGGAKRP